MSVVNVRIYDPLGVPLAVLDEYEVRSVTWRLATGQAELAVPYRAVKCTRTNLKAGNLVYLEFDDGLPPFAGVMSPPRRERTAVSVRVAQPDKLLSWRYTGAALAYATTRNAIARSLLAVADAERDTLIDPGAQYAGSAEANVTYNSVQLLNALRDLAAGEEYELSPRITGSGRLRFDLDWYGRRGIDRRDTVLLTDARGANVGSVVIDEQEPFHNHVVVIGTTDVEDATWDDRPRATALNTASRDRHGLRTTTIIRNDIDDEDTLQDIADAQLADSAWPAVRATLERVRNAPPAEFADYGVGDIVTLDALGDKGEEWAYTGAVRVLARAWHRDGTCTLEVAEWLD